MVGLQFRQRRNRIAAACALSIVLAAAGIAFGFINALTQKLLPHPDYYKVLMKEIAHQHYLATGTPTIVKENDQTREFFQQQYDFRNRNNSLSEAQLTVEPDDFKFFAYLPYAKGMIELTMDDLAAEQDRPGMKFTQPSGTPVALWVYSRRQNLLSCIFYELPEQNDLEHPGKRVFQTLDRNGIITIEGELPETKLTPIEAYLLSLGDLKLENLAPWSKADPNLRNLDLALPMLFDSALTEKVLRPSFADPQTIGRMRREAGTRFLLLRGGFRYLLLPVSLLMLIVGLLRFRSLHREFCSSVKLYMPVDASPIRIGNLRFLFIDPDYQIDKARADARERQNQALIEQKAEEETRELKDLLQEYRDELVLNPDEVRRFEEIISTGTLEELRSLRDQYHGTIQQLRQHRETEQQQIRERQREIQRLQSELEMVPVEKRADEGREAWELYEQAKTIDDPRARLNLLKEARKRLPREFRPERF